MRWISTVLRWVALLLAACSGLTLFTSAVAGMLVGAGNVALGGPTYFHGVVFFVAVPALEVGLLVGGVIASVVHHRRLWSLVCCATSLTWAFVVLDMWLSFSGI